MATLDTNKSYVYENTEVRVTGRQSTRQLPSGKLDILVEVTPLDNINGSWKKWIMPNQLYTVIGE